jgi:hypothetical protein
MLRGVLWFLWQSIPTYPEIWSAWLGYAFAVFQEQSTDRFQAFASKVRSQQKQIQTTILIFSWVCVHSTIVKP